MYFCMQTRILCLFSIFVISFPGGLQDETDTDFIHTALRETEEELRISKDKIDVWGTMSPVPGKVSIPIHA